MASTTYPDGSPRVVTDDEYELLGAAWSGDGVVGVPSDTSPVYGDSSGLSVKFRSGKYALVHGHGWAAGATAITKSVTSNSSGQPRVDLAVLGLDRTTFLVTEYIKTGTPAASPVPPSLLRDPAGTGTGKWEIPLATIAVASGAATIAASDVTTVAAFLGPAQILYVASPTVLASIPGPVAGQLSFVASVAGTANPIYQYIVGTGWRRLDWATSWGVVGGKLYPGSATIYTTGATLADSGIRTGSTALLGGRRYEIRMQFPITYSATTDCWITNTYELRKGDGTTAIDTRDIMNLSYAGVHRLHFVYAPAADETQDFQLWAKAVKGSFGTTFNWSALLRGAGAYLQVFDIGPTSMMATA